MSTSSMFQVLRYDKKSNILASDIDIENAYEYSGWKKMMEEKPLFGEKPTKEDIPDFVSYKHLQYVNQKNKKFYDIVMEMDFNSLFSVLIDDFNLSPYPTHGYKSTIEISIVEAREMLQALNYLLLEKYDKDTEEQVLKNRYIKLFDEGYAPYHNYYERLEKENINPENLDEDDKMYLYPYNNEYYEQKGILERVKNILNIFLTMVDEDSWDNFEYILLYTVY